MHELTVTQKILETSLKHAQAANAKKILRIKLVIGQLTSFIDDSIVFYWNLIAKDTIAQESILEFSRIPAIFLCQDCQSSFHWENGLNVCPVCKSSTVAIKSGTELYIEFIEID
jgi:hydrogenase nickel incorporation protein HypA/HybF